MRVVGSKSTGGVLMAKRHQYGRKLRRRDGLSHESHPSLTVPLTTHVKTAHSPYLDAGRLRLTSVPDRGSVRLQRQFITSFENEE